MPNVLELPQARFCFQISVQTLCSVLCCDGGTTLKTVLVRVGTMMKIHGSSPRGGEGWRPHRDAQGKAPLEGMLEEPMVSIVLEWGAKEQVQQATF